MDLRQLVSLLELLNAMQKYLPQLENDSEDELAVIEEMGYS